MKDAQAIPDNLFCYSDQTTGANSDLQRWISAVLTPVIRLYQQTAVDFGNNIYDLTAPDSGSVDMDARAVLSQVSATDKEVRIVGQAFLDAGDQGLGSVQFPSGYPVDAASYGDPDQYAVITVPDSEIENDLTQGQEAAHAFQAGGDVLTAQLLRELAANEHNHAWTADFFNNLSEKDILILFARLRSEPDTSVLWQELAQAYDTALASGQLSPAAVRALINTLLVGNQHGAETDEFAKYFLADLAKDPAAAAVFIDDATDQQLQQLLNGDFSLAGANSSAAEAQIIGIMTIVLQNEPDQASAAAFYNRIWPLLKTTQPRPAQPALAAAMQFLSAYVPFAVPPLTSDLRQWALDAGKDIWALAQQWANWIGAFEIADIGQTSSNQTWTELEWGVGVSVVSLIIGVVLTVTGADAAVAIGAAAGSTVLSDFASAATDWITQQVDSGSGDGSPVDDAQKMEELAKYYAELTMLMELIAAGDVIGPNGQPVDLSNSQELFNVLLSAIPDKNGNVKNEQGYHIKGQPGTTVADIIDHAAQEFLVPTSK